MAIAGLHNVPIPASSILRESQSLSSGRHGNQGRIRTRASPILQMWRELEDECAVNGASERGRRVERDLSESENGSVSNLESHMEPMNENEDQQSMTSEQSQDLGEVERERVRKIFREWMNSGVNSRTPNIHHMNRSSGGGQWLGETERERVRVVREWIQMTSEQREACVGSNREEQVAEIGCQIERVRDGQVLDHNEGQVENNRREIRRLCGRQALLDLLAKKEQERRLELQGLETARPVSSFAHRNRIQSLLRIRCFQNMRSVEFNRSSSAAESELGLLRQRQTVSGLREGFLSRFDNSVHVQASGLSDGLSDNNSVDFRDDQTQANSAIEFLACAQEQNDRDGDDNVSSSADLNQLSRCSIGESDSQELVAQVEARLDHALDNGGDRRQDATTISHPYGSSDDGNPLLDFEESSRSQSGDFSDIEEIHELFHQQYNIDREEITVSNQSEDLEHDVSEEVIGQESSSQVEEYEETEWEGSAVSNHWRADDQVETDRPHSPGDVEESSRGALGDDAGLQDDAQEDYWHENDSQETPRDWLEMPSAPGATSSGRVDMYFSDDDNVYNMELRELLNRRRVSSLLHSGFRESLDQLIQSYVERQTHAPDGWELHAMSPPHTAARGQEQLHRDPNEEAGGTEGSLTVPPTLPRAPQEHGQQMLHHTNWSSHEIRQRPETEWETINDLRIDMARLQHRLTNMQKMLEDCMDMQLELQRSVRQEVSAALNRSINSSESLDNVLPEDSFKWDRVRKWICCICSDSNIDSLLYRCGHMCTCTKCADILLQGNGKCPMCQAPVVEVIRAYFIQ